MGVYSLFNRFIPEHTSIFKQLNELLAAKLGRVHGLAKLAILLEQLEQALLAVLENRSQDFHPFEASLGLILSGLSHDLGLRAFLELGGSAA